MSRMRDWAFIEIYRYRHRFTLSLLTNSRLERSTIVFDVATLNPVAMSHERRNTVSEVQCMIHESVNLEQAA